MCDPNVIIEAINEQIICLNDKMHLAFTIVVFGMCLFTLIIIGSRRK